MVVIMISKITKTDQVHKYIYNSENLTTTLINMKIKQKSIY